MEFAKKTTKSTVQVDNKKRNRRRLAIGAGLVGGAAITGAGIYALKRRGASATRAARPRSEAPPVSTPQPRPSNPTTPKPRSRRAPTTKATAKPAAPRKPLLLPPAKNRADAFPDRIARAQARTPGVPAAKNAIPIKRSLIDTPETLPRRFERGAKSKTSGKTRTQKTNRVAYEAGSYRKGQGFIYGSQQQGPKTKAQTQYEKISKRANDYKEANKRLGKQGFEGRNSRTYGKTKAQKSRIVQNRRDRIYNSGMMKGERTNLKRSSWDPKDLVPQEGRRISEYDYAVRNVQRTPNAIRDRYLQKGVPQRYSKSLGGQIVSFNKY
jgi:hypothetical protein